MNLVIVESPAKAKTIQKILGNDYIVKASVGHVRDLPDKALGIDVKNNFEPHYVITQGRESVIKDIVASAKKSEKIFLAPDPDREGEAIAWHLKTILEEKTASKKKQSKEYYRVQYNEITTSAVKKAFENPGEINIPRVNAQQARRILDRLVGFKTSPILWQRLSHGRNLSAGRVQSVALRLVCEREQEIKDFVSVPYWVFSGTFSKNVEPTTPFRATLNQINNEKAQINTQEHAESITKELANASFAVKSISKKDVYRKPYPPFITSTLQQSASTNLGFSPKTTMAIAQSLYEGIDDSKGGISGGLITYMRTDSMAVSEEARAAANNYIRKTFGSQYLPETANIHKNKDNAQAAHECIRPTNVEYTPQMLKNILPAREFKLYELIWNRFVASQMSKSITEQINATIQNTAESCKNVYSFSATASNVKFDGFSKVYGKKKTLQPEDGEKEQNEEQNYLPPLEPNEKLNSNGIENTRKETKPPSRYSEASLVKALESNGIGRPSTYASIISTLLDRKYVSKLENSLQATDLGEQTNDILVKCFPELFNVKYTASMEDKLDEVETEKVEWHEMLKDFYEKFSQWLKSAKGPSADMNDVKTILDELANIKEWAAPTKNGRRTFDDQKFVNDIRNSIEASNKDNSTTPSVSEKQYESLIKIACHYKSQLPNLDKTLERLNKSEALNNEAFLPPRETTMRKFEILDAITIPENSAKFYASLRNQANLGRRLSEKQISYLNKIFLDSRKEIPNFSKELCDELEIEFVEEKETVDNPSIKEMLLALAGVKQWSEPQKRGKKVYNDVTFFQSLERYLNTRGSLSDAQTKSLTSLFIKYRSQIPNFDEIVSKYNIEVKSTPKNATA